MFAFTRFATRSFAIPRASRSLISRGSHCLARAAVEAPSRPHFATAVTGVTFAALFGGSLVYCHKTANIFEISELDEMHEFQTKYAPEDAYKKAKDLAVTYHKDVNVIWRAARAAYNLSEAASTPKDAKKTYMEEALRLIREAEELDNNNSDCHRWHGIILSGYGKYQSSKDFIANTFVMRDHWKQAVTLNPQDASAFHLLGRWSFDVAEMAWWKRKIATALFAEPPSSTFDEALEAFERAERISPGFWKMNQVMLAKSHQKLGHAAEAKQFLQSAVKLPVRTAEDAEAHAEAEKLLAAMK